MSTEKMSYRDLMSLNEGIKSIKGVEGKNFSILLIKNFRNTAKILNDFRSQFTVSDEYREYNSKVESIYQKHAPKTATQEYDEEAINKEKEALDSKYKKAIEEYAKNEKAYTEKLDNEVEVTLYKIPNEFIPENIKPEQLGAINALLDLEDLQGENKELKMVKA